MSVSAIVSTYNWPGALELVVRAILKQTVLPAEIIVADDGSGKETEEKVLSLSGESSIPVKHVWQDDRGFRKTRILNRAVMESDHPNLLFLDGDCVPSARFLEHMLGGLGDGMWAQGYRVRTTPAGGRYALRNGKVPPSFFLPLMLRKPLEAGIFWSPRARFSVNDGIKGLLGCAMLVRKADLIRVNGWNEAMSSWGGEDKEFSMRLLNGGVHRNVARTGAAILHLWHPERSHVNPAAAGRIHKVIESGAIRAENGLSEIGDDRGYVRKL